jgi:hypothetical protein
MQGITAQVDSKVLQEKANEFAQKGAIKALEEYYTGYNSPYVKAIRDALDAKSISCMFDLPDIIGLINNHLSAEIDALANEAIAKTYIPMVREMLVREERAMTFSDFLRECIKLSDMSTDIRYENSSLSCEKHQEHGWYSIRLSLGENNYSMTLHECIGKEEKGCYQFLSLPNIHDDSYPRRVMSLKVEGAVLEIPFASGLLKDRVYSFIARLLLCKTLFKMDVTYLEEDMFPSHCHCD